MTKGNLARTLRRWTLFASWLLGSLAPTFLLTLVFHAQGHFVRVFLSFWSEILVGPVKYWLRIMLGHPSEYAIHAMSGATIWVYLVCLVLMLAHPVKPARLTASITGVGFLFWYAFAFLQISITEY
jgi:hypothetical protein